MSADTDTRYDVIGIVTAVLLVLVLGAICFMILGTG